MSKTILYLNLINNDYFSKEIVKAKSKNPSIDFSYFIMICKLYKMKPKKKENKNNQNEQVVWSNAEEEIFDEVCLDKMLSLNVNFY